MAALLTVLLLCLLTPAVSLSATEFGDLVISDRQVWHGEIQIKGRVRVTREGHLTLQPGTKVLFSRIDLDADGIGDAELFVEGEFVARGTQQRPILLTSAEPNPQPGDWKFLYFDYARKAEMEYLISEYAYSGVQLHFCRADIGFSEFRYNIDGVRFSTANITLKHSYLHHNRHGIRFEERGGKGVVQQNRISENQIGIFAVTRSEGRTRFEQNDIVANSPYQVKMGLQQSVALDFPHNWWGGVSGLSAETVFDHRKDRTLGRVTGSMPLSRPFNAHRKEEFDR